MSTVIISGGALGGNNTSQINNYLADKVKCNIINLKDYKINHYRYDHQYDIDDDFIQIVDKMISSETIIFSTPMYWYAMSGHIKVFLDRWTDLLKSNKELGRRLRGKRMGLIYNSNGEQVDYFEMPFINTADYLGIEFIGSLHINMEQNTITENIKFHINKYCSILRNEE